MVTRRGVTHARCHRPPPTHPHTHRNHHARPFRRGGTAVPWTARNVRALHGLAFHLLLVVPRGCIARTHACVHACMQGERKLRLHGEQHAAAVDELVEAVRRGGGQGEGGGCLMTNQVVIACPWVLPITWCYTQASGRSDGGGGGGGVMMTDQQRICVCVCVSPSADLPTSHAAACKPVDALAEATC